MKKKTNVIYWESSNVEEKKIQHVGKMWANQNEWQVAWSSVAPGVWESSIFSVSRMNFYLATSFRGGPLYVLMRNP